MIYRLICPLFLFLKRRPKLLPLSLLAVVALAFGSLLFTKIFQRWDNDPTRGAVEIKGGAYGESYATPRYLDQGWRAADSLWFYNTTQGSGLLPYDFFVVLEVAETDSRELFKSDRNIDKFRYLPQKETFFNPDALPVGFVKETYQRKDYVGYTCAACHTGQVNYKREALRIDGGPAMANMVGFLTELERAMKAAQSGEKYKRFIAAVKERKNDYGSDKDVEADLKKWTETVSHYNSANHSKVDYGHARLDAFGRIYNRVKQHIINKEQLDKVLASVVAADGKTPLLSKAQIENVLRDIGAKLVITDDEFLRLVERLQSRSPGFPGLSPEQLGLIRDKVFNAPNAPVSYPFLWDIAHSDYVQWNGLAGNAGAGPLGRNAGEVIGVFGILDWGKDTSWFGLYAWFKKFSFSAMFSGQGNKKEVIDFKSSIDLFNLQRLESHLRSLKSPQWPFCRNGKGDYYLPVATKDSISPEDKGYCSGEDTRFDEASKERGKRLYNEHCLSCHVVIDRDAWDRVVVGKMLSLAKAGTDPAMAENSVKYKGKSGNFKDTYQTVAVGRVVVEEDAPVVQILTAATSGVVATPDPDKWFPRRWVEWAYTLVMSFADNTIKPSVKSGNYDPDTTAQPYASLRSYKARSLNGIWATAPYLHNGSVPTLFDLLHPRDERPSTFKVGAREFDPRKVGFRSEGYDGFSFTTSQPGNLNQGHEYSARSFSDEQRWDLIEYLKSL